MAIDQSPENLEKRLSKLEREVCQLRRGQEAFVAPQLHSQKQEGRLIRAHFSRGTLARKPFVVTIEGSETSPRELTPIRTAILLALLIGLLEKSEGSQQDKDTTSRVREALEHLAKVDCAQTSDDAIRVALYRAGSFIKEQFSSATKDLTLEVEKDELVVLHQGVPLSPRQVQVDITTSDQAIFAFLDQSLKTSPLARLRKSKTLFVPPGDDGQDLLLLELLGQDAPIKECCLFYRPTIQSLPPQLMAKLGIASNRRQRQELALQGYRSGRLHYTEVLPRQILWKMIEGSTEKGFSFYPAGVDKTDVISHLDHLQFLLLSFPSYELVLTDAFFPFYLNTFEITQADETERFVLFFQQGEEDNFRRVSVFALKDDAVFFSTESSIVRWILSHPTTLRHRQGVLAEIQAVRNALLKADEDTQKNSADIA